MSDLIRHESLDSPEMRYAIVGNRVSLLGTGVYVGTALIDVIASHSSICAEAAQCVAANNTFQLVEIVSGAVAILSILASDRLMQNARDAYMSIKIKRDGESSDLRAARAALKAERGSHAKTQRRLQETEDMLGQYGIGRLGDTTLYGLIDGPDMHS